MKKIEYERPEIGFSEIEMSAFICTSIKTMQFYDEVDEYDNVITDDDLLFFDN